MTTSKRSKMSNDIARKFFLHDQDENCCFFGDKENGWGFWVRPDGTVDVDDTSSNGELPSRRIIEACVRSAKKYLAK